MMRKVYVMRHAQTAFGSDDPSLTERGDQQAKEATRAYLLNIEFDAAYSGTHIRHKETGEIAVKTLGLSCEVIETPILALTKGASDQACGCVIAGREHPQGLSVGFRVDTWFKMNVVLMDFCKGQLQGFFQKIPEALETILAVSSSPIVDSATLEPKNRLVGNCGIIKYTIDDLGTIISSEVIFEGFFEKPPQKKS